MSAATAARIGTKPLPGIRRLPAAKPSTALASAAISATTTSDADLKACLDVSVSVLGNPSTPIFSRIVLARNLLYLEYSLERHADAYYSHPQILKQLQPKVSADIPSLFVAPPPPSSALKRKKSDEHDSGPSRVDRDEDQGHAAASKCVYSNLWCFAHRLIKALTTDASSASRILQIIMPPTGKHPPHTHPHRPLPLPLLLETASGFGEPIHPGRIRMGATSILIRPLRTPV